ncbi:flagellar biosynthesis protein FlgA [Kribbella capetownensis]|uniref:Flagellar biosynthesis protein FlgA n=1 Tax=Kribbella capetownensis TaxID=1572659 RepID=A0A4R0JI11_9ACTN|nr:SAF domain-containing protein [Kribbella capetownensis]TCC45867.1 flagellar biosynthesis protein FlgA [Kribbella capetownensis]
MSTTGTEMVDRQRQRANRASNRSPGGRLPTASKRRRPTLAALAALLIVGGALIAGVLAVRMDERVAVVQVARDVSVGSKITKEDLAQTRVSGDNLNLIPADDVDKILGRYAKVNLVKGQLLDGLQTTRSSPISDDKAAVGVVLLDGRVPATGLMPGDEVRLIKIGQGNTPATELGDAVVLDSPQSADEGSGLGKDTADAQTATMLVDRADVTKITDASGNNRIAVALLKSGTSLGDK